MTDPLQGRHLLLGVTGGIAAYKACELVRLLTARGVSVQVVMTEAATRFVGTASFQALTGRPVYTDIWDPRIPNGMAHIALSREAEAILVAPASLDFLSKVAQAQTPDLLSLLCSARDCPLYVAPAMNRQMWENPASQAVITQLRDQSVGIWGPGVGAQACGETGDGRMLEANELVKFLEEAWSGHPPREETPIRGLLAGRRMIITAGPTFEPIDPVRGITNRSTGRMGYAIAEAAALAGAQTLLISGPTDLRTPAGVTRVPVLTACEMFEQVQTALSQASPSDVFCGVAAVADWRPKVVHHEKIKKESTDQAPFHNLEWVENPDILAWVGHRPPASRPFTIGFAAETATDESLATLLPAKRARKAADLLIGNDVRSAMGGSETQLWLESESGCEAWGTLTKPQAARALIRWLAAHLGGPTAEDDLPPHDRSSSSNH